MKNFAIGLGSALVASFLAASCETTESKMAGPVSGGTVDSNADSDTKLDGFNSGDADADADWQDTGSGSADETCADLDSDGWCGQLDCDDLNPARNRSAAELQGNGVDEDCDGTTDEIDTIITDTNCEAQDFAIAVKPVGLMILVDLSSSMKMGLGCDPSGEGSSGDSKWKIARKALSNVLNNPALGSVQFGFDVFPTSAFSGSDECGVNYAAISDIGPGMAATINGAVENLSPNGLTPLWKALHNFDRNYRPNYAPLLQSATMPSYLLVLSDGQDTCGAPEVGDNVSDDDLEERSSDLLARGIKTMVIGFDVCSNTGGLNAIAKAGGTDFKDFIDAQDEEELEDALDKAASSTLSCQIAVKSSQAAADPSKVNFYFNGEVVPYDENCQSNKGWKWSDASHTQAEFCQAACARLRNGEVAQISAKFGCQSVT